MKKILLCVSTLALCGMATPALADSPHGDDPPGCSVGGGGPVDNDPTGNGCPGGNGGPGGDNGGGGGAGGGGGNANNSVTNTNTNTNTSTSTSTSASSVIDSGNSTNTNTNSATGGSATASTGAITNTNSATGGSGGAGGASNSGGNTFSNVTNYKRAHRIAPPAYAPTVMVGTCQKSTSGGISTPFGGLSLGGSRADRFCQMQALANWFASNGRMDVACRILYNNDRRVSQALTDSGVGCPAYQPPVVVEPVPPTLPTPPVPERRPENG